MKSQGQTPLVVGLVLFCTGNSAAFAADAKSATPSQCYTSFNAALYYAKDLKSLSAYFTRARQGLWRSMAPASQEQELKSIKNWYVSEPKVLAEKITGKKAHITVRGMSLAGTRPYTATVNMDFVREDNYWKVDAGVISGVVRIR